MVLFHTDLKNGISNIAGQYTNISRSESDGLELSYTSRFKRLLVESSVSYVKSKDLTNNAEYKAFPKTILNLGIGYQFSDGWSTYVNNRAHLGAYETTQTTAAKLKDYWRLDINVTKSLQEKLKLFLNVRNALDRQNYLPSLVDQEGGIPEDGISVDLGVQYQI